MTTTVNYAIHPNKLAEARGKLIVAIGHDINWSEFAQLCGITLGTVSNIRNGRSGGTTRTGEKIVDALRAHGVAITLEDLLAPAHLPS